MPAIQPRSKLPILLGILIASMWLSPLLFVGILADFFSVSWVWYLVWSAYLFIAVILNVVYAILDKVNLAFPLIASALGCAGLMCVFVLLLIG